MLSYDVLNTFYMPFWFYWGNLKSVVCNPQSTFQSNACANSYHFSYLSLHFGLATSSLSSVSQSCLHIKIPGGDSSMSCPRCTLYSCILVYWIAVLSILQTLEVSCKHRYIIISSWVILMWIQSKNHLVKGINIIFLG